MTKIERLRSAVSLARRSTPLDDYETGLCDAWITVGEILDSTEPEDLSLSGHIDQKDSNSEERST